MSQLPTLAYSIQFAYESQAAIRNVPQIRCTFSIAHFKSGQGVLNKLF